MEQIDWAALTPDIKWIVSGLIIAGGYWGRAKAWELGVQLVGPLLRRIWPVEFLTIDRLQDDGDINEMIIGLRAQTHCWRAQFWQFHNGGKFRKDHPKFKFTLTHEAVAPGQSSQLGLQHNLDVHVSFSPGFLCSIYGHEYQGNIYVRADRGAACALCPNAECKAHYVIVEGMNDAFLQTLFRRHNAAVVVYVPVMDVRKNSGRPIGFVALHFGKVSLYKDRPSEVHKALCDTAKEIGFILGGKTSK